MIRVFGQITDASGKGVAGAMIELRALKSSTEVLYGSVLTYKCDASGHYEFPLAIGAYDTYVQNDICGDMDYLGTAVVTADTDDGDLHHILVDGGINITPPMLDAAMEFALRAEKAATSAKSDRIQTGKDVIVTDQNKHVAETKAQESATSADEAKAARDSIVQDANEVRHNTQQVAANAASVASNTALVQRKAEQVAQNTQTVSTKALQVSENTQSVAANTQAVSLMRDEVVAKTSMAQAAADTATQKAASAAEHDAAAAEYARQAQEAAQATAGALIDGGAADLSTGVYPQPVQVSGTARPTFWKVTKGGTVGGVDYGVGDTLIYTVAGSGSYYKIDNTESVTSVQGEKGAVTLTPEKIGAEVAGTAAVTVQQHEAKSGAHNINGVSGLKEALDAKVNAGPNIMATGTTASLGAYSTSSNVRIQLEAFDNGALDIGTSNGNTWGYPFSFFAGNNNSVMNGSMYIGANKQMWVNQSVDFALNVQNQNGSVTIGCKNKGAAHIYTDNPFIAMNKNLVVGNDANTIAIQNGGRRHFEFRRNDGVSDGFIYKDQNGPLEINGGVNTSNRLVKIHNNGCVEVAGQTPVGAGAAPLGGCFAATPGPTAFVDWGSAAAGLEVSCPLPGSAYAIWKATGWGRNHIACMMAHESTSFSSSQVQMYVGPYPYQFHANGTFRCAVLEQTSDERTKTNITSVNAEAESILDKLKRIEVIRYDTLDGTMKGRIGYRAQQLSRVMPEMVRVDESCEYAVNYADMSAANTAAIQELAAIVEVQKGLIDQLLKATK
ncbi:MAG: tail fiber domain-containing protein [Shewanella sp.]